MEKRKDSKEKKPLLPFKITRHRVLFVTGIALMGTSFLTGSIWMANPLNQVIGMTTVVLFGAGGFLVWRQFKNRNDDRSEVEVNIITAAAVESAKAKDDGKGTPLPNSLNIYATKDGEIITPQRIAFEYVEKPMGQPQRCVNTDKYCHVHILDFDKTVEREGEKEDNTGALKPFLLPDSKFTDPAKMARYLSLPSQQKYLKHRESLMKMVGPGLLMLALIGGFITIIAMGG